MAVHRQHGMLTRARRLSDRSDAFVLPTLSADKRTGNRLPFRDMTPPVKPDDTLALEVEHLTVALDGRVILQDLSFSVATAAWVAVIGPNGAGKTVLFRTLIGALPFTGTIRWAPGMRMGYVPQKLDIERSLPVSGRDLLTARARLTGAGNAEIDAALTRVGLAPPVLDLLVGALSGGQFQRLLMASALLGRPTLLLLDEPTTGVDEPGQVRLNDTLQRLRHEGLTVITISHDLSVVSRFATDVLCVTRNHSCLQMSTRVLTPQVLADVYGEPVAFFRHDESHS